MTNPTRLLLRWISCLALFGIAAAAQGAPRLAVLDDTQPVSPGATIDYGLFGQTVGNDPVFYFFDLSNTGDQPLDLSAITISGGDRFVYTGVVPPTTLGPGESTRLNVRFRRNVLGTHTHTVTLSSNDPAAPAFSFHVRGTVAPDRPLLEVRDGSTLLTAGSLVDYGSWPQTATTSPVFRLYELRNAGAQALDLTAIGFEGSDRFVATGVVPPITLEPGESTQLNVRFRRDQAGTFNATVALYSNDPSQPFAWQVRGTVTANTPRLEVQDGGAPLAAGSLVDYGTYTLTSSNSPVFRLYTLTNRGDLPLDLTSISISGGDRFVFTGVVPPITLAPGESTPLNVRFRRDVLGTHTHTVTLRSNDAANDPFSWQVRGRIVGNGPHLEVRDGARLLSPNDLVDYGPVARSDAGPVFRFYTLTNSGDQDLDLSAITITGGATRFVYTGIVPPTTLPPGGVATLNVRFRRDVVGLFNATVSIASNDPQTPSFHWRTSGEVRSAPEISVRTGAGTAIAPGDRIPYPDTAVGTSNSVRFVIENHGESDLTVANPNGLVSGESFFVNANGIENPVIPPGGQEDFRVALSSPQAGTWSGTVTIDHDGLSHDPFIFEVEGRTGEPDFTLAADPANLSLTHGASRAVSLSVEPEFEFDGDVDLAVSGLPAGVTASFEPPSVVAGGSASLTLATSLTTPTGTSTLTVTGTSGGLSRSVEIGLEITDLAAPEITSVSPDVLPQGEVTVVTLTGRGFSGAGIFVPEGPLTTNDPPRWTPPVRVLSIATDGRSMEVEVDATDPRVMDFYNLVVDSPAGPTGAAVRVVPPGPVVDVWTPGEPEQGNLYVLLLTGANLGGATVSSSDPRVRVFDVENTDEEVLTGLLEVEPGAPIGTIDLLIDGLPTGGGLVPKTTVPLEIKAPGEATKESVDMRRNPHPKAGEVDPGGPGLFLQEGYSRQKIEAGPEAMAGFCLSLYRYRRRQRQKVLAFDPATQQLVGGVLDGLEVGDRIPLHIEVYSLFLELQFEISFGCHWDTHGYACITATIGFEVLGRYGQVASFQGCVIGGFGGGFSFIQATTGGIFGNASFFTSTGGGGGGTGIPYPCLEVAQQSPFPIAGGFDGEIEVTDCCNGETPIFASASGSTFAGQTFGGDFDLPRDTVATADTQCRPEPAAIDYTVVGWIDRQPLLQTLSELSPRVNFLLKRNLNPISRRCVTQLTQWGTGFRTNIFSDADRLYANAFLLAFSANSNPGSQIDVDEVQRRRDFRAFLRHRMRVLPDGSTSLWGEPIAEIGPTPSSCKLLPFRIGAEEHPTDHGRFGLLAGNRTFSVTSGRIDRAGQTIDLTLNDCRKNSVGFCTNFLTEIGKTTPWIWAVIETDASGDLAPDPPKRQLYPTYSIYRNGERIHNLPQAANPDDFIRLDADDSHPPIPD